MDFIDLAKRRYSVRNYRPDAVEREKLQKIVEAAMVAPSAVNFQPWKFIVVTDPELLGKLQACYHREWFKSAPACIVALGDHDMAWHRPTDGKDYTDIDVAIAIDHMMLAAAELGLGTCWICHFNDARCSEIFGLPANLEPIAMVPVGYPVSGNYPEKKRKSPEEVISWNSFGE